MSMRETVFSPSRKGQGFCGVPGIQEGHHLLDHPEHWLRKIELLHFPNHNTETSNGGINHVMGSHGHLDFEAFVC